MRTNHCLKHFLFKYYAIFSVIGGVVTLALFLILRFPWQALLAIEGGIISFAFAVQKQQLEEIQLFKELFKDFNDRYDRQNEDLNCIYYQPAEKPLSDNEVKSLFNYFNLCGEEYLFYERGFIYPEVWHAWENGMKYFRRNQRVQNLWDEELKTNSYYGLNFNGCPKTCC